MIPLPFAVQDVIVGFAPLFSKRVFAHVTVLIAGAILSPGKRTGTAVLRVMSKGDESGTLAPSLVSRHADAAARGRKWALFFLLCCRCCQAPLRMFFSLHSLGAVPHAPVGLATCFGVGTDCLQRPSIRASSKARHPMLSASFDNNWKVCRRRPHLSDGFFAWPGSLTGRLHQHQGQSLTQHHWRLRFELCPLW